jgi:hypothetical protein
VTSPGSDRLPQVRETGRDAGMSNPHDKHEPSDDITPMMLGIGGALLLSMVVAYFVSF